MGKIACHHCCQINRDVAQLVDLNTEYNVPVSPVAQSVPAPSHTTAIIPATYGAEKDEVAPTANVEDDTVGE